MQSSLYRPSLVPLSLAPCRRTDRTRKNPAPVETNGISHKSSWDVMKGDLSLTAAVRFAEAPAWGHSRPACRFLPCSIPSQCTSIELSLVAQRGAKFLSFLFSRLDGRGRTMKKKRNKSSDASLRHSSSKKNRFASVVHSSRS